MQARAGSLTGLLAALALAGAAEATGPAALTISVGGLHACAIVNGPELRCWGEGGSGRLGNGSNLDRGTPVPPVALDKPIQQVSAGGSHTCVLTVAGGVICFGWNGDGQLGDGTTTSTGTGIYALGLWNGVQAIAAGDSHTCALADAGTVKCWGAGYKNSSGKSTPVDIPGLTGVDAISTGKNYSCGLMSSKLKCWSGAGSVADIPLGQFAVWKAVSVGDGSTCGVVKSLARGGGTSVRCWGSNNYGELGDGTKTDSATPVDVQGSDGFTAVTVGKDFACALTDAGGVKCWGRNDSGQLGDSTHTQRSTPVDVVGLASGGQAVDAGTWSACALTAAGEVKCWGNGASGQVGDGFFSSWDKPVSVAAIGPNTLTISITGALYGNVTTSPGAIDCLASCKAGWANDAWVKLTAVPTFGSFVGWSGACTGSNLTCAFAVDSDKAVTATFQAPSVAGPKAYNLNVAKAGAGSGTVTSNPAGVSCGADCTGQFAEGATVTLTAAEAAGSTFSSWSGACSGTDPKCTVTMTADRAAKATFAAASSSSGVGSQGATTTTKAASSSPPVSSSPSASSAPSAAPCVVPDVKKLKLAAAKAAIKRRHCQVGSIRRGNSRSVRKDAVIWQSPKPGTRPKKPKVSLLVSRGP